jgi:hypothetical protein
MAAHGVAVMADLTEFGGGVAHDDPNREDEVKIELSQWFNNDVTVYWDQQQSYGHNQFTTNNRERPDLVIEGSQNNFVVEVKVGDESGKIYDGMLQTVNYWEHYLEGITSYRVGGKELEIEAVLLATNHSPKGRLFHNWENKDPIRTGRSEGAQRAADIGVIPQREHCSTETALRAMNRFSRHRNTESQVGVGALLSSSLDGDDPGVKSSDPMAFYFRHDSNHPQNWESIPWYLDQ